MVASPLRGVDPQKFKGDGGTAIVASHTMDLDQAPGNRISFTRAGPPLFPQYLKFQDVKGDGPVAIVASGILRLQVLCLIRFPYIN